MESLEGEDDFGLGNRVISEQEKNLSLTAKGRLD